MISNNSNKNANKAKSPGTAAPVTPMKRRASLQSLFPEDQQSSDDDDDDMGTSSTKSKLNSFGNTKSTAANSSISSAIASTTSYKERLEAKRKKSALDLRPVSNEDKKPLTITPPPLGSVTPKQKLPNKTHLVNSNNNNNNNIVGPRPTNTPPAITKRINEVLLLKVNNLTTKN